MELSNETEAKPQRRLSKKQLIILVAAGIVLVGLVVAGVLWATKKDKPLPDSGFETPEQTDEDGDSLGEIVHYAPLTGLQLIDDYTARDALVTGVMIENSPESRPQSGLAEAEIVFEAIANGGVSRFAALYQTNEPTLIGPVRSLRMQFLDWMAPFNATIAHVGGSYDSLQEVRNYRDIDQFSNGAFYWRTSDRYAPHNVYTSGERLLDLAESKGYQSSDFSLWERSDEPSSSTSLASKIRLTLGSATYNVVYDYQPETGVYKRSFANGQAHLDRERGQLAPTVVVAIRVAERALNSSQEVITTTGSGDAYLFQNGQVIAARWQKLSRNAQLELFDELGNPLRLARGQTWVTAIPNNNAVTWE